MGKRQREGEREEGGGEGKGSIGNDIHRSVAQELFHASYNCMGHQQFPLEKFILSEKAALLQGSSIHSTGIEHSKTCNSKNYM